MESNKRDEIFPMPKRKKKNLSMGGGGHTWPPLWKLREGIRERLTRIVLILTGIHFRSTRRPKHRYTDFMSQSGQGRNESKRKRLRLKSWRKKKSSFKPRVGNISFERLRRRNFFFVKSYKSFIELIAKFAAFYEGVPTEICHKVCSNKFDFCSRKEER